MRSRPSEGGVALSVLFELLSRFRDGEGSHLPTYAEQAMVYLAMQPSASSGFAELRRALAIGQSRSSRLCTALERIGWVKVVSDRDDGRRSTVTLTLKGRRVIDAITTLKKAAQ